MKRWLANPCRTLQTLLHHRHRIALAVLDERALGPLWLSLPPGLEDSPVNGTSASVGALMSDRSRDRGGRLWVSFGA